MNLKFAIPASFLVTAIVGISAVQAQTVEVSVVGTRTQASAYPTVQAAPAVVPVQRGCTQLEMAAGIEPTECGHHPLSFVAATYLDLSDDG